MLAVLKYLQRTGVGADPGGRCSRWTPAGLCPRRCSRSLSAGGRRRGSRRFSLGRSPASEKQGSPTASGAEFDGVAASPGVSLRRSTRTRRPPDFYQVGCR